MNKIVVTMTLELPVEVPEYFDVDNWIDGIASTPACKEGILPPNEYHQCICSLIKDISWRLPKVEDEPLFDENQLWESGDCKPKEGIDC